MGTKLVRPTEPITKVLKEPLSTEQLKTLVAMFGAKLEYTPAKGRPTITYPPEFADQVASQMTTMGIGCR